MIRDYLPSADMESSPRSTPEKVSQLKIRVKYDDLSAKYANQVIINGSSEEVYLDFSSGAMTDPSNGESTLSIHTRIAMSPAAAWRLAQTLQQTLSRLTPPGTGVSVDKGPTASLPRLG